MAASHLRYKDKVTIVTGGSKGIGLGCVRVFVSNGSKVVFCARGDLEGKKLEEEVNKTGPGEAYFVKCDVSKEEDLKNLVDKTVEKYGQIDCLINNAGWHPPFQTIDEVTRADFMHLLNLNLVSYFSMTKFCLPYLRKTQGNIINMSSLVGQIGQQGAVCYVATKGAITAFSKALAIDEAKYDVRVNTVSPGNVWTPLWESATEGSAEIKASGANAQLCGRYGTIEECGLTCLYLAADATFCTGTDHYLSGGAELNYAKKNAKLKSGVYD